MPVGVVGLQPRQAEAEAARNYLGYFTIVLHEDAAACRRPSSASILSRRLLLKKIGCPFPLPPSASPLGAGLPTSRAETLLGYDAGGLPNARSCRVPAVESCKKLEVIFA
ncbi:unnamed protein product [Sphagnum jensenii]|uniref:Uncharacterized protein n=1 Tax=Sphagnum jensenii TaxID=128206 RepID=A0ABP1BJ89_9BRYO